MVPSARLREAGHSNLLGRSMQISGLLVHANARRTATMAAPGWTIKVRERIAAAYAIVTALAVHST